jgi:hypothetical protein
VVGLGFYSTLEILRTCGEKSLKTGKNRNINTIKVHLN